jgi:D-alanyl-D-alanine carboxypeptidase
MLSTKIQAIAFAALALIIIVVGVKDFSEREKIRNNTPRTTSSEKKLEMDPRALLQDPPQETVKVPVKPAKPLISAEAYLVGNVETGEIYIEHNPGAVFPIASLSKLITAMIATHSMKSDQKITITQSMLDAYGDAGHLVLGETFTVSELLYPLLLESSNDAAEAIAEGFGFDSFIALMNSFVRDINMTSTSFKDSSGLSSGNVSNSRDLFTLSRYLYANEKSLLDLSRLSQMELASTTEHGGHIFHTINPFPGDPHFIGGKTGRTIEARESMISLFSYPQGGKIYPIAIIVLRSDWSTREIDSGILFEQAVVKIGR